jgi:hypothetical protein
VFRNLLYAATIVAGAAVIAAPASAAPKDNAIQPSPVYFGQVQAGTHPHKDLVLKNVTGRRQVLRRFDLAGAGGRKFTLTWRHATCRVGTVLEAGQTCTLRVRVATERPEFWQTTLSVYYGRPPHFKRGTRGQFNTAVFAHVVA